MSAVTPPSSRLLALLRAVYGGLPARIWWLGLGMFVNRAGFFAVPMLLLFLTQERGIDPDTAANLFALYGCGAVASAVAGGWMSDGLGRRPTLLVSLLSATALWATIPFARGTGLLGLLLVLAGFASDLYRTAAASMIADLCNAAQRPKAYALSRMASNAGMAIGPAAAGLLAERAFALVFLGESLTCFLFASIVFARLPESRERAPAGELLDLGLRDVLRDWRFLLLCLANFGVVAVYMQQLGTLPLLVVEQLGRGPRELGLLLSLNGAMIVALEIWIVQRTRRSRPLRAVAFGSLLVGVGFGSLALAQSLPAVAACVVLWTVGEMIAWPMLPDWVARRAPVRLRGRYLGVSGLFAGLALLLGVRGGPWLARHRSFDVLWVLCLCVCTCSALLALLLDFQERRAAPQAAPGTGPSAAMPPSSPPASVTPAAPPDSSPGGEG